MSEPRVTDATPRPNPYVGPRSFVRNEPLFGRGSEARDLLYLLIAERIVLLYSPSGAGKTSLIQAALIPALEREHFQVLPIIRLSRALPDTLPPATNRFLYSTLSSLEERLPADQQLAPEQIAALDFGAYLQQRMPPSEDGEPVLIFDQFEEVLTIDPANVDAKHAFFEQLGAALANRQIWALFSIREDFLAALDPFMRPIPNRFKDVFRLDLLSPAAARQAMQGPAKSAEVTFTDAAANKLADDLRRMLVQRPDETSEEVLGPYVEPVQLQVVCLRLWEKLFGQPTETPKTTIGEEDIEGVGSVNDALAGYYLDRVRMVAQTSGISERAIRDWFDRQLITPEGRRGQVLRQRRSSAGLDNAAIGKLIDAHLIRAEERRGATWFELAHDRLIAPIREENAVWREANLSLLQLQATLWDDKDRPDGLLLEGASLTESESWAAAHTEELTSAEREFLNECIEKRTRQEKEARANRIRRRLLQAVSVIGALVLMLAVLIYVLYLQLQEQYRQTQAQARFARVVQFAAQALDPNAGFAQRSLLLGLEAVKTSQADDPSFPTAEQSLHVALVSAGGLPLRGHTAAVRVAAFSPKGDLLATAGNDATIRLWRLSAPERAATVLRGHTDEIIALAFGPDGDLLATGSNDATIRLWQMKQPDRPPIVLRGHTLGVTSLAFSPNGRQLVSGSVDGTTRLWRIDTLPPPEALLLGGTPESPVEIHALAFSHDGRWLVAGSINGDLRLWNMVAQPPVMLVLRNNTDGITSVAFSPDDRWVAAGGGSDNSARLWRLAAPGDDPFVLQGHEQPVAAVVFSHDSRRLATASFDGTARLWDVDARDRPPAILRGHDQSVIAAAFSRDGRWLATASEDGTARLWQLNALDLPPIILRGHAAALTALDFSPDSQSMLTGSVDGTARLWRIDLPQSDPAVFHPDDQSVRLVAFGSSGGLVATGGFTGTVWLHRTDAPAQPSRILAQPGAIVGALAASPNGDTLAAAYYDGSVRLWPIAAPERVPVVFPGDGQFVGALAFSPDGARLATGNITGTVWLWRADAPQRPPVMLLGHNGSVVAAAFSPNSRQLATGGNDATVRVWNVDTPIDPPIVLRGHTDAVSAVVFSRDGRWLATGSFDRTVRLWQAQALDRPPIVLRGQDAAIFALAFSPDSRLLATGSEDGITRLWTVDQPDRAPVALRGPTKTVTTLAFSSDGRQLATGSDDGTVRLWHVQVSELVDLACAAAGRNLSVEEWEQFIGDASTYHKTCATLPLHESRAVQLILQNRLDQALEDYTDQYQRDPTLESPAAWLVRLAGAIISADYTNEERVQIALTTYARALSLDSQLMTVNPSALNDLCRYGGDQDHIAAALDACNRAVQLDPANGNFHYNRALLRGKTGDLQGTIADLQAFIPWATGHPNAPEKQAQASAWIRELQAGRNPFAEASPAATQQP